MKIKYNSPVILTFAFIAVIVQIISTIYPEFSRNFFSVPGDLDWGNFLGYPRLLTHVLGHADWKHLMGNVTYILLLGPVLEEKYGGKPIIVIIIITALVTGFLNVLLFDSGLMGASGIVFMLITLVSFSDIRDKEIPLTFILVALIFVGAEVMSIFNNDNVSQATHIVGALCGGVFGFIVERKRGG